MSSRYCPRESRLHRVSLRSIVVPFLLHDVLLLRREGRLDSLQLILLLLSGALQRLRGLGRLLYFASRRGARLRTLLQLLLLR